MMKSGRISGSWDLLPQLVAIVTSVLLLIGCTSDSKTQADPASQTQIAGELRTTLPSNVSAQQLPSTGELEGFVVIDGDRREPLVIDTASNTATGDITVPEGQHNIQVVFEFVDTTTGNKTLLAESATRNIEVAFGTNDPQNFSASEYNTDFDDDGDGISNLRELANEPPVADAGPDQTRKAQETVTLDGSGSADVDDDSLTYRWSLTSVPAGSQASLSDPTAVGPTFVVDITGEGVEYIAQLIVNDGLADSAPDTVTIDTENTAPVAEAGPNQTRTAGETVTLDGSASSDVDGDPLTYRWSLTSVPAGSEASLSDPNAVRPSFVVDVTGEGVNYVAQLIVNDGGADSEPDTVTINTDNTPPVANAGPDQTRKAQETVTLDGSASSDVDGDSLTFRWSLTSVPEGSQASLSDPTAIRPTFVVDITGEGVEYIAQLIVNDGLEDSAPDSVTIDTDNSVPVANAGPDQTRRAEETVTLDGSGSSDVDGDSLTYRWSLSVPAGSEASLSDPTAVRPTFVVDVTGEGVSYVAQLIVNDGLADSEPDTVTINTDNTPPVAEAGPDQTRRAEETVTLDGSGSSDVDGDSLTYRWSLSVPAGSEASLSDPTAVRPTFVVDVTGEGVSYVAQLIVNDGLEDSEPDSVTISLDNHPVADAGPDQTREVGDTVTLDGSASSDVDGDSLTYRWSLISTPVGSRATLSDPAAVNPTFVADLAGTYVVQLVVNDGSQDSDPDTVTITVPFPTPELIVSCSSEEEGGDLIFRGFYIPNYPGNSVSRVELFFTGDPGDYTLSLELRANTYDGVLLGRDSAAVTLSGLSADSQLTTFEFPDVAVTASTTVTFAIRQLSGPESRVWYDVHTDDPSCPVVQTNDTSPPLSTFRRDGVRIRIFGSRPDLS